MKPPFERWAVGRCAVHGTVLVSVLAACAETSTGSRAVTEERDSAGVVIYESRAPRWRVSDGWTLSDDAVLDLTMVGRGLTYEFYDVADAVRLSDGRIAVSVGREIRLFSEDGLFLRSAGGDGDGPGEFRWNPLLDVLPDDSLVAFDFTSQRVTMYGPSLDAPAIVSIDARLLPMGFARMAEGFVAVGRSPVSVTAQSFGLSRHPLPVVLISRSGRVIDTLTTIAGNEIVKLQRGQGSVLEQPPFGRESYFAASHDKLVVGDAVDLEYRIYEFDGSSYEVVRGLPDLVVEADELNDELSFMLGQNPSAESRRVIDGLLEAVPKPVRRPAYRGMLVDGTGAVWLEERLSLTSDYSAWQVFSPSGEWLGQVTTAGRFRIFDIGSNSVLGVLRDELDVERVQVRALRR